MITFTRVQLLSSECDLSNNRFFCEKPPWWLNKCIYVIFTCLLFSSLYRVCFQMHFSFLMSPYFRSSTGSQSRWLDYISGGMSTHTKADMIADNTVIIDNGQKLFICRKCFNTEGNSTYSNRHQFDPNAIKSYKNHIQNFVIKPFSWNDIRPKMVQILIV